MKERKPYSLVSFLFLTSFFPDARSFFLLGKRKKIVIDLGARGTCVRSLREIIQGW